MLSLQNVKASHNRIVAARCMAILLFFGGLMMTSITSTTTARARGQASTEKFQRVGSPIPDQYIVVLNDDTSVEEVFSTATDLVRIHGGTVRHIYRHALKGFSVQMSEAAALALSRNEQVEFVEEDGIATVGDTQFNPPWGLDRIDEPTLPLDLVYTYNEVGTGVNAYVIDTGVRITHQDFGGRAFLGVDCSVIDGSGNCVGDGTDFIRHGTPVAGILGGSTHGAAKNVTIYNVRVCGDECVHSNWIAGIDWVTNNHVKPAVANQSLGTVGGPSGAIDKATRRSIAAGVTHVVCAQNSNTNASSVSPARVTQAITIGATGHVDANNPDANPVSDERASFSNFGSVLDLFAPGVKTPSASAISDTAPVDFGGTSASSPYVAGAVARYLQIDPTACPSTVSEVITSNATNGVVIDPGPGSPNKLLFTPQAWPAPTFYSLSLNGTSAYVNVVPVGSTGVSLDITGSITVEAWIKTNEFDKQDIVARYNPTASTGTDGGYAIRLLDDNRVRFRLYKNINSIATLDSTVAVPAGQWHHVAGVFNGTQMKIFIDGIQRGSLNSTFTPGTGTSNLRIGIGTDNLRPFNGLIDEARVTAAAVYSANFTAQHRLTGVVGTTGLWRFDRQNAKDCADIHNGTLVGGATFSSSVP